MEKDLTASTAPWRWLGLVDHPEANFTAGHPVPEWAKSVADIGAWITREHAGGRQLVVVLVVPARGFAPVLAGFGGLLGLAAHSLKPVELVAGTRVTCLMPDSHRLRSGIVEGMCEQYPNLYRVRLDDRRNTRLEVSRRYLFATESPLTLERAQTAERVVALLEQAGVHAPIDDWLEHPNSILLAGTQEALFEQACRLSLATQSCVLPFRLLFLLNSDRSSFGTVELHSARGSEGLTSPHVMAVLDGPEALSLLEYDEDHPHHGLARSRASSLLLLTEDEYAREKRRVSSCLADWGGQTISNEEPARIAPGLAGAGIHARTKPLQW